MSPLCEEKINNPLLMLIPIESRYCFLGYHKQNWIPNSFWEFLFLVDYYGYASQLSSWVVRICYECWASIIKVRKIRWLGISRRFLVSLRWFWSDYSFPLHQLLKDIYFNKPPKEPIRNRKEGDQQWSSILEVKKEMEFLS